MALSITESGASVDAIRRYASADTLDDATVKAYKSDAEAEVAAFNDSGDFDTQQQIDRLVRYYAAYKIATTGDSGVETKKMSQGSRSVTVKSESTLADASELEALVQKFDPSGELIDVVEGGTGTDGKPTVEESASGFFS